MALVVADGKSSPISVCQSMTHMAPRLQKLPGRLATSLPVRSAVASKAAEIHDSRPMKECMICAGDFPMSPSSPGYPAMFFGPPSSSPTTPDFPTTPPTPRCKHEPFTCVICVRQHIESRLEAKGINAVDEIDCPSPNCREKMGYDEVRKWASSDSFAL